MTEITASAVRELRERTGAGMMDCKKALGETQGDMEAAIDWLRKKGLAAAAKKSGRAAAEGLVGVVSRGTEGALIEVNAETDFVARNEHFQAYVKAVSDLAFQAKGDLDILKNMAYPGTGRTVEEELTHLIAVIGENLTLRRTAYLSVSQGVVASYLHTAVTESAGRIGVLVALESSASTSELASLGKQIAMHAAAANPQACAIADLSVDSLARERAIYSEQALASGKPAEFVDKMVEGRMRKFYEESVLSEQVFLIDDSKRVVKQVVADKAKDLGADIALKGFVQFRLGEGVEKKQEDFAAEVAAQLAK
jgi:elongation factor Ts